MSENKRVLNFPISDSKHLIKIVEGLTEIKADIDAESTPSSIQISVYGSEKKVKSASEKIYKLFKEAKNAD